MTYEEFEKRCISTGETDLVYLRWWWNKHWELEKISVRYF